MSLERNIKDKIPNENKKIIIPLKTDFPIPEPIEEDINELIEYLNSGGQLPDCLIENLRSDINSFDLDLSYDPQEILRDYYVRGGYKHGKGC